MLAGNRERAGLSPVYVLVSNGVGVTGILSLSLRRCPASRPLRRIARRFQFVLQVPPTPANTRDGETLF